MERIKRLNRYQKGILVLTIVMVILFFAIYAVTISRVGFEYKGAIFVPTQGNQSIVYSGKIRGQQASFTVSEDKTVVFRYGDKTYGPYTAKEDPSAIPEKEGKPMPGMTGVELFDGDSILFRGAYEPFGNDYLLFNEDGSINNITITFTANDGIERDENGNIVDPAEPSASTILRLMNDPPFTHKGEWVAWFGAAFICVLNSISILFADELFRFRLMFQIRDTEYAEPSDWEMIRRYIGWTFLLIAAFVVFIIGLQ